MGKDSVAPYTLVLLIDVVTSETMRTRLSTLHGLLNTIYCFNDKHTQEHATSYLTKPPPRTPLSHTQHSAHRLRMISSLSSPIRDTKHLVTTTLLHIIIPTTQSRRLARRLRLPILLKQDPKSLFNPATPTSLVNPSLKPKHQGLAASLSQPSSLPLENLPPPPLLPPLHLPPFQIRDDFLPPGNDMAEFIFDSAGNCNIPIRFDDLG